MMPVSIEPELRSKHVGFSSPSDIRFAYGEPSTQQLDGAKEILTYYSIDSRATNIDDVLKVRNNGKTNKEIRITRFSFNDNRIVQNVTSNATVRRKRFDGGSTVMCVLLSIGVVIATPIVLTKIADEY